MISGEEKETSSSKTTMKKEKNDRDSEGSYAEVLSEETIFDDYFYPLSDGDDGLCRVVYCQCTSLKTCWLKRFTAQVTVTDLLVLCFHSFSCVPNR